MGESIEEKRNKAHVHWLVVGPIRGGKAHEPLAIYRDDFAAVMEAAGLSAEISIEDRLGGGDQRTFSVVFPTLRAFSLKEIVKSVDELGKLLELATKMTKGGDDKVEPEDAPAAVEAIVGAGKLRDAVAEAVGLTAAAPAGGGGDSPTATGNVDEIFEKASVEEASPKKAVDKFVGAMRSSGSSSRRVSKSAKTAARLIEDTVYGVAGDVLAHPEVARLEAAFRGLKLLADQCPEKAGMLVELHDVPADAVTAVLRTRPPAEEFDQPDAIFVPVAYESTAPLAELADIAEGMLAPVVVGASPKLFGADDLDAISGRLDDESGWDAWNELRGSEACRWLAVVTNDVVLHSEGGGSARRSVLGSPVWGLGAMLASSFARFSSFARVVGRPGALESPGLHTLDAGKHEGVSVPTGAFVSIRLQTQMAKKGIIGIGSGRNDNKLVLSELPTVRGSEDAMPLPAQMLTGRIVRFATWVRDQVPKDSDADQIAQIFHQASSVFLFPGLEGHAILEAGVDDSDDEKKVVVHARVAPAHALVPLDITFALPLT